MFTRKRQHYLFPCALMLGLLTSPVLALADTTLDSSNPSASAPVDVTVPSTYTITMPPKVSVKHLGTDKQDLAITVDAKLEDNEVVELTMVNATSTGLVALTNGKGTLHLAHRRAADDQMITSSDALIASCANGQATYVTQLQAVNWDDIMTGGSFKGSLTYAVKLVKTGG